MNDYTKPKSSLNGDGVPNEPVNSKAVVQVKQRKKSPFKSLTENFFAGDWETIKEYAVKDVIVPAVKRTVSNLISNTVDMLLFGEVRRNPNGGSSTSKYTSYSSYYDGGKPARIPVKPQRRTDYRDFLFPTIDEAQKVIDILRGEIEKYDRVRVRELHELCGMPFTPADENYGWYDLSNADFDYVTGNRPEECGYILKLPSPVPLDR